MKIFIDGSSPKEKCYPSAYCIFKEDRLIYTKVLEENIHAQDCEYLALIEALNLVKEEVIKDDEIEIFTDCGFMVEELNYVRKPKNLKLFDTARELLQEVNVSLKLISRYKNPAGKYFEKRLIKLKKEKELISHPIPNPKLRKLKYKRLTKCL